MLDFALLLNSLVWAVAVWLPCAGCAVHASGHMRPQVKQSAGCSLLCQALVAVGVRVCAPVCRACLSREAGAQVSDCGCQVAPVRVAAEAAGKALVELLSPLAVKVVLPTLLDNTETKKHWQVCFPLLDIMPRMVLTSEVWVGSQSHSLIICTAMSLVVQQQVQQQHQQGSLAKLSAWGLFVLHGVASDLLGEYVERATSSDRAFL